MVEVNDLPGEITVTRRALIKVWIGGLFIVGSRASFAFQRLLVATPLFDFFTIRFVARRMNALGFAILLHLSMGMHDRLLPIGFIIILDIVHHGLYRLIGQFALRVAGSLILSEQADIPVPILALSLFPFRFPVSQSTIRQTQLLKSFASPISFQELVPLVPFPIILRVCLG